MRILIVQTAFLGDVVLTIPLIESVRSRYPDSFISVMLIPSTKDIIEGHPAVNKIIVYDKKGKERGLLALFRKAGEVRAESFDWALVPHRSFRSALLTKLAGIPRRRGFNRSQGRLFLNEIVPYRKGIHDLERNLDLLGPVNRNEWENLIPINEEARGFAESAFAERKIEGKVIAVSPGSAWPTKRWPVERFSELIERFMKDGYRVIVLGSRQDIPLSQRLTSTLSFQAREALVDLTGKTRLKELAAVIERSALLVSNDSAAVHIAAAQKIPVVAIFGPTTRGLGFYPYGDSHRIVEKKLPCRPCGKHGGMRCRMRTHQCMEDIGVDEVYQAAKEILGKAT